MQALLHIISLIISELSGDFLSCNVKLGLAEGLKKLYSDTNAKNDN
jgi:hypothetical protein